MPYTLEKMLSVRAHRENKAMNHMVQCQGKLNRALELHRKKETELSEFRSWRQHEEQCLFNHLQGQPATVQEVMIFLDTTSTLREGQAAKAQEVVQAQKQAQAAEDDFRKSRQEYVEAYRKKVKIEEHKAVWEEENRFQVERDAEKEMEEFVHTKVTNH